MHKKQFRALLLSVILSSAAYGLWVSLSEPEKIMAALHTIGVQGAIILLGLSLVNYFLRFVRYHFLMKSIGDRVPSLPNFLYYLSGFALTTTPGKAGESIRYIYLKPFGVPFEHAIAVLLTERFLDLMAVWAIALLGIWTFEDYRWVVLLTAALCTIALVLIQQPFLHSKLQQWSSGNGSAYLRKISLFALNTLEKTKELLHIKPITSGFGIGLIAWGAEAAGFVYLIELLGYDIDPFMVAAIYAASMLIGALSFLPGGLGGAEITMHILLLAVGVSASDSVAATLICRIATLWFAVVIGIATMAYLELINKHAPSVGASNHKDGPNV